MADFTADQIETRSNPLTKLVMAIWNGLIYIGENSARARAIRELNMLGDEELEARGLTRTDIVKRVFSDGYHI